MSKVPERGRGGRGDDPRFPRPVHADSPYRSAARSFDRDEMMIDAAVIDGRELDEFIHRFLRRSRFEQARRVQRAARLLRG